MSYYKRPLRPDELMHFGIPGMKWGIRRYQNPDGTLTQAGKLRKAKQNYKDLWKEQLNNGMRAAKDVAEYPKLVSAGLELSKMSLKTNNIDHTKYRNTPYGTITSNGDQVLTKCKNSDSKYLREYYNICKKVSDVHTNNMKDGTVTFFDKRFEKTLDMIDRWAYTKEYLSKETSSQRKKRREKQLVLSLILSSTNDN